MMMYYCFCHPSQPFVCVKKKKPANTSLYMNSQTSTPHLTRQTTAKSIYSQKVRRSELNVNNDCIYLRTGSVIKKFGVRSLSRDLQYLRLDLLRMMF